MTADEYYRLGNESRKQGKYGEAISYYMQAEELDPDGPAATARQMLEDILNFYCKDMYNP
ncbi:MAG: tetratricopeptide repeat protein [Prevotella sp.]|nr:tetratricopeptide repeat protein [Prevotella sp.]